MNYLSHSHSNFALFHPLCAWLVILGFLLSVATLVFAGAGSMLRILYPLGTLVISVFLYKKNIILYTGFAWWVWFLSAWVSRMSDFQSGSFDETRLILLAPYLTTLVIVPSLLRKLSIRNFGDAAPFLLAFFGIMYGVAIGTINVGLFHALKESLDWFAPILFGFHLYSNWHYYPELRKNMQQVFMIGVLISGGYGILQYMVVPEWDRFWVLSLKAIGGGGSLGLPEPGEIRVFSIMNSPGPFAVFLSAGLLLLPTVDGVLKIPSAVVGHLSLLLSIVRSAWGGWFLGFVLLLSTLKIESKVRLLTVITVLILCVVPLAITEPFNKVIVSRVDTLTDIRNDPSALGRQKLFAEGLDNISKNPVGLGVGGLRGVVVDSAFLDLPMSLGWAGTVTYLTGLLMLVSKLFDSQAISRDPFANSARSIVICVCSQMLFGSSMLALMGVVLWGFLGMGVAAYRYENYKQRLYCSSPNISPAPMENYS